MAFDGICSDDAMGVTWIDLCAPTAAEVQAIGERFGFHPLAIEDAQKLRQRPKVDVYENHLFFVIYALVGGEPGPEIISHELAIFATEAAVISVHAAEIAALDVAERRWAEHCRRHPDATAGMLVYTISDAIVDGYFPIMDSMSQEVDAVEERMFDGVSQRDLEEIFKLKRTLVELRRIVAPTRDVFNAFTRREVATLGEATLVFYQDLYDHVIRVTESIDAQRDVLSSAIDVYVSLQSNYLNQTVRTLTAASIVLMSMTLVAGIYGMNFERMPELSWRFGYAFALIVMLIIGAALAWFFRRLRWW